MAFLNPYTNDTITDFYFFVPIPDNVLLPDNYCLRGCNLNSISARFFMLNAGFLLVYITRRMLSNKIEVPLKDGSRLTLFAGNGIVRVKQSLL